MSSEKKAVQNMVTLAEFEEVFKDFLGGNVSLAQLRQCLLDVIASDADALPNVQAQIDAAMYSGQLPEQTWENLIAEIDHLVSENTPTEWSDEDKITAEADESPLLAQDNDGPMLFDEDLAEPPVLAEPVQADPAAAPMQPSTAAVPTLNNAANAETAAARVHPSEVAATTESTQPMPEETHELPPGTVLEDRFVLVSKIENGSMGTVYKALDQQRKEAGAEDPWVAIKLITADFSAHSAAADALKNEAGIGARLNHPNIARTHALHEDGEHIFISMEWLDGESLSQLLDRKRPHAIPREQALKIIEHLALGLAHAHDQGVVHADIKPGNVYITQTGEIKLLDFGIARHNDDMPAANGLLARTPAYASCEVLEGDNTCSQDDLFSLAAVAYRVLAGQRAFGSANALEAENEQREPVPVPGLAPQQWRAMRSALAWRREDRSADVQAFITEFFGEEEIVLATPVPAADQATTPSEPAQADTADQAEPPRSRVAPAAETSEQTGISATPDLDPFEDEDAGSRRWLRPALAAVVVAAAVAAVFTFMPGEQTAEDQAIASISEPATPRVAAANDRALAANEIYTASAIAPGTGDELVGETDARVTTGPEGEELMLFVPGTGIAMDAPSGSPVPNADNEQLVTENITAAPDAAGTDTSLETAVQDEPQEPAPLPAVAATTVAASAATSASTEDRAENAVEEATDEASQQEQSVSETTLSAAATGGAAATAAAVSAAAAEAEKAAEVSAAEPAPAPAEISEPPEERDTVELPAEPVLASTMSLAMVSPDSEPRQAAVEQATVPVPEPAVAPEPEDIGPPGEFAPPQIPDVLLSTLKFDRFVEPKFPRRASKRDITGWVDLEFVVGSNGKTSEIKVKQAEPAGVFEEAAVSAVERWRFKPHEVDGESVDSRTRIRLRFD